MRLLRRDTSAELTRVEQAIEAAEARQAELAKQYEAALESDDSIDEVRALKHQMDEKEVERTVLYGRREKREAELAVEREEQDRRDYQAEVDETVARLPRRAAAAKAIEKALRDLANATKEFVAASAAAGLPTFRLGTLVQETFAPDRGLMGRRHPPDYLQLASAARGRGFAEEVEEEHVEHAHYLRHARAPRPVEDESEPENTNEEEQVS